MSKVREEIACILKKSGAIAVAATHAEEVEERAWKEYLDWLSDGMHASMTYMENHLHIRKDPRLLLEGAKSIITLAFNFHPAEYRDNADGMIACYAYGEDYHDLLRRELNNSVQALKEKFGGEYRICIDSAPIMERYWAVKSGLGMRCANGSVEVEGFGNMLFLAEILTTLDISSVTEEYYIGHPEDEDKDNCQKGCDNCNACTRSCPAGALLPSGMVNSRKCISYLTIEHRGDWISEEEREAMNTRTGRNTIFGCDLCLRTCHLNRATPPTDLEGLKPRETIMQLSPQDIREMTQEDFSRTFKGSPIKRAKLAGLKRNIGSF